MTYNSLVQNIQQYLERNDQGFIDTIPTIIAMTETQIAAELKTFEQLIVVETNLAQNQTVLNKPARWRKTISMKVLGQPVLLRSQDYVAQYLSESLAGKPAYYADYDYSNWNFAPQPDQSYPVEIIYYAEIQPLDINNQQNMFTAVCPQLLLYGALYHASVYLKALDKIQVYQSYYTAAIGAIKKEDNARRIDRNTTIQEP